MHPDTPIRRGRHFLYDFAKFTLVALLIITPFRFYVAQPFIVSGASMEPTLEPNEYLVIDELSYRFEDIARGDVIVFRYPLDPATFFIKRVVGLPGETVEVRDGLVFISTAGGSETALSEPYRIPDKAPLADSKIVLEANEYFVMGDNRSASSDSRVWGPVKKKFIIGRAFVRLFPFDKFEYLPGDHTYTQ